MMLHKSISCDIAHRTIFNAIFPCGNMLQDFESDSKSDNIVVVGDNVALKLSRVTYRCRPLPKQSSLKVLCNMQWIKNRR